MKLFPAKISEAKSMTSEGNSALLTDGRRYSKLRFSEYFQLQNFQPPRRRPLGFVCHAFISECVTNEPQRTSVGRLQNFQLYNKSLKVWSLGPGDNQSLIKCLVFHESQYFDRLSVFKCLSANYNCFYHENEEDEVT